MNIPSKTSPMAEWREWLRFKGFPHTLHGFGSSAHNIDTFFELTSEQVYAALSSAGVDCYLRTITADDHLVSPDVRAHLSERVVMIRDHGEGFHCAFPWWFKTVTFECADCGAIGMSEHLLNCPVRAIFCNARPEDGQEFLMSHGGRDPEPIGVKSAASQLRCELVARHTGYHQHKSVWWATKGEEGSTIHISRTCSPQSIVADSDLSEA